MSKSAHYELKQIYYGLLQSDPDYPAWQDFEYRDINNQWLRLVNEPTWGAIEYRYNPLPKKWEPINGWDEVTLKSSGIILDSDLKKLQAYATKLSWLREQGGHEFKLGGENYHAYKSSDGSIKVEVRKYQPSQDTIYMSEEQAEKWIEMVKNGEV